MSVIIKGMEMPKRCGGCPLRGVCKERMYVEYRPKDCPLTELPPHGRLIDSDKLKSRLVLDNDSSELQRISADILKWIDIQETVIEAEGSET